MNWIGRVPYHKDLSHLRLAMLPKGLFVRVLSKLLQKLNFPKMDFRNGTCRFIFCCWTIYEWTV